MLKDKEPCRYVYLFSVLTGWRCCAGVPSNVILKLKGSRGRTKILGIPNRSGSLFQSGAEEWFAVGTNERLGTVYRVFVGHDGPPSSSWSVHVHSAQAMATLVLQVSGTRPGGGRAQGQSDGLPVPQLGPGQHAALLGDQLRDLLRSADAAVVVQVSGACDCSSASDCVRVLCCRVSLRISQVLRGKHLWLSALTVQPHSRFNHKMRLTCCLALLLLTMVSNMMFFGVAVVSGLSPRVASLNARPPPCRTTPRTRRTSGAASPSRCRRSSWASRARCAARPSACSS